MYQLITIPLYNNEVKSLYIQNEVQCIKIKLDSFSLNFAVFIVSNE